jgi:hypothetical protein
MRMRKYRNIFTSRQPHPERPVEELPTKVMRIKVAAALETMVRRLPDLVRAAQERRCLRENREAITQYNRRVAERGFLADDAGLLSCRRRGREELTP